MVSLDEAVTAVQEIIDDVYYELEEEDKEEFVDEVIKLLKKL
jgi:hypothetical protein